jgi:hypothetical protein
VKKRSLLMPVSTIVMLFLGTPIAAAQSPSGPNMFKPQGLLSGPTIAPAQITPPAGIRTLQRSGPGVKHPGAPDGARILFEANGFPGTDLERAEIKAGVVSESKSNDKNQNQSGATASRQTGRWPRGKSVPDASGGAAAGVNLGLSPAGQKIETLHNKLAPQ